MTTLEELAEIYAAEFRKSRRHYGKRTGKDERAAAEHKGALGGRRSGAGRPTGATHAPPSKVVAARVGLWALTPFSLSAKAQGLTVGEAIEALIETAAKKVGATFPTEYRQGKKAPIPRYKAERAARPKKPPKEAAECLPDAPCSYAVEGARCTVTAPLYVVASGGKSGVEKIPARYCLVELEQLQTSHTPLSGFGRRAGFPYEAQERDYRLPEERAKVEGIAQAYEPELIFSTAAGALDGLPVATEERFVLGGNGRTMATELVYAGLGGVPASTPRDYLIAHAKQFGLKASDLKKFKHPMVVRTIRTGDSEPRTLARWSRRLNASLSQQLSTVHLAVSQARYLDERALRELEAMTDEDTLTSFLSSTRSRDFVHALQMSGVIEPQSASALLHDGLLNPAGREMVSALLVAMMIPNAGTITSLGLGPVETLARSAPYLLATQRLGEYSLLPPLRKAVKDRVLMRSQEIRNVKDLLRQSGMFGGEAASAGDPLAVTMLEILLAAENSAVKFAKLARYYYAHALAASSPQVGLFGALDAKLTPVEALLRAAKDASIKII